MRKVAVLVFLMILNIGAVAQELIFSDDSESPWPDAWAQATGWSAFVVKDSTGTLVGPVVGFWTGDLVPVSETGLPLVAISIRGEKIVFKTQAGALGLGRRVYFEDADCSGQAYLCLHNCAGERDGYELAILQRVAYAVGPGNVLYRAVPPSSGDETYSSYDFHREDDGTHDCINVTPERPLVGVTWTAFPDVDLDTMFTPPFSLE